MRQSKPTQLRDARPFIRKPGRTNPSRALLLEARLQDIALRLSRLEDDLQSDDVEDEDVMAA